MTFRTTSKNMKMMMMLFHLSARKMVNLIQILPNFSKAISLKRRIIRKKKSKILKLETLKASWKLNSVVST